MEGLTQPMSAYGVRGSRPSRAELPKEASPRLLCAILLSPPRTPGVRTRQAVARAANLIGCPEVRIVNLVSRSTDDLTALARERVQMFELEEARSSIAAACLDCDDLLFGWGLLAGMGLSRPLIQEQIDWLVDTAIDNGHDVAWAVGDARHPSRWHQYTADRHVRTSGGDARTKLQAALLRRQVASFRSAARA